MATLAERLAFFVSMDADQAIRAMEKVGATAEKELEKGTNDRIDQLSKSMTRFGALTLGAAGVGARGLATLGNAAGEQNAAVSANTQVLGENAAAVQAWAENSVEAAGLSETAALTATTSFAAIAKAADFADDRVVSFATSQVELAADMAAFKDVTPEQALQDLEGAYAGSLETLRKYNVQINEQALKQAYARETGEEVTGTLTAQQRVIAVHAEVMRQTVDIQGQWNRESDELLGQKVRLSAELDNMAAEIGQGVLPVMSSLVGATGDAVGAFGDLPGPVQEGVGTFATYATAAAGVTGALSLAGGQALKMRDNFTTLGADGTRSLNKLGRAARGAGYAIAAIAAYQTAELAFDALTNRIEDTEEAYNDLVIALGQDPANSSSKFLDYVEESETFTSAIRETHGALNDLAPGLLAISGGGGIDLIGRLWGRSDPHLEIDGVTFSVGELHDAIEELPAEGGFRQGLIDELRELAGTLEEGSDSQRILNTELDVAQRRLDKTQEAASVLEGSMDDVAGSADDATASIESTTTALEDLTGQIRAVIGAEDAALGLADAFDDVEAAAAEAAAAEPVGGEAAEQSARDYRQAVLDLEGQILDYSDEIGGIPEEALTDIIAALDQGDLATAEAELEELTRARTVQIQIGRGSAGPNSPAAVTPLGNGLDGDRAGGGPVAPYRRYRVGELGEETLEMGSQPGYIVPAGQSTGATVINIHGPIINRDRAFEDGIHRAIVMAGA